MSGSWLIFPCEIQSCCMNSHKYPWLNKTLQIKVSDHLRNQRSEFFHCIYASLFFAKHSILLRNLTIINLFLKFIRGDLRKFLINQLDRQQVWQYWRILALASKNTGDFSLVQLGLNYYYYITAFFLSLRGESFPKRRQMIEWNEGDIREQFFTIYDYECVSQLAAQRSCRCDKVNVLMFILSYLVSLLSPLNILIYF